MYGKSVMNAKMLDHATIEMHRIFSEVPQFGSLRPTPVNDTALIPGDNPIA